MIGAQEYHANSGGPASRTRVEQIVSTLLGRGEGEIRCPRIIRVGLEFWEGANPVKVVEGILRDEGYESPEELRDDCDIPEGRLICRPLAANIKRLPVRTAAPDRVLTHALLLGLCTAQVYDPARPVLWTQASLTRGLELFSPEGFYAWTPNAFAACWPN